MVVLITSGVASVVVVADEKIRRPDEVRCTISAASSLDSASHDRSVLEIESYSRASSRSP